MAAVSISTRSRRRASSAVSRPPVASTTTKPRRRNAHHAELLAPLPRHWLVVGDHHGDFARGAGEAQRQGYPPRHQTTPGGFAPGAWAAASAALKTCG